MDKIPNPRFFLLLIIFLGVIAAVLYFRQTASNPQLSQVKPSQDIKQDAMMPYSAQAPSVKWAIINYGLYGKITDIKPNTSSLELIMDFSANSSPKVIITKETKVTAADNKEVAATDLKKGQSLMISIRYDVKKKAWTTTGITVLATKPTPLPSSPAKKN